MTTNQNPSPDAEWLEADGLGGFASGTAGLVRTRRYHALLLAATAPPAGRVVLVNGLEAWIERPGGAVALSSQRYAPDVIHPDGASRVVAFTAEPWPRWTFALGDGTVVEHELFVVPGRAAITLAWRLVAGAGGMLCVRPLLSGRDYHALHAENAGFRFDAERAGTHVVWRPYPGLPAIGADTEATYAHEPVWYRRFAYAEERARGLDDVEDLASPGVFRWTLGAAPAVLTFAADGHVASVTYADRRDAEERRRARFGSRLERAADAYLVRRGAGKTVIAGYPWFTDWGRDTFIALRGLCLATGRHDDAVDILREWAGTVSDGMLPNRFPDDGGTPEFNAVDAALWFVVAAHALLDAAPGIAPRDRATLEHAMAAVVSGYARGTRHGIRADADGLLAAGEPGVQLTWMDAKIGDWLVTPRIGKPVEVQALWLNALRIAAGLRAAPPSAAELHARAAAAFSARFWNAERGYLYDVVDVDHRPGAVDPSFRPNQILAVGGLPYPVIDGRRARHVVDAVEARLVTPMGLRSLAPGEPGYAPRYAGGPRERDAAYHQGTVWPWLIGPFIEAWLRVHGDTPAHRDEARRRFLAPLLAYAHGPGLSHLPEVADGDPPHRPGGCPQQAWSLGEVLRLDHMLAGGTRPGGAGPSSGATAHPMDAAAEALRVSARLGPLLVGLPEEARPRFLAALERRAGDRYDAWAASAPSADEAEGLRACAARERRIAELVEERWAETADEATHHAPLIAEAATAYLAAFEGRTRAEGFAIQAALERAGAAAWRGFAAGTDAARGAVLLECAALEEASAGYLEQLSSRG